MKTFKAYLAYLKDNPEGYWFKRKLHGWGWTPATREGWLVTLIYVGFILFVLWRSEQAIHSGDTIIFEVIAPIIIATIVFIVVCWQTGESPAWQWNLPKKYFEE